jgi:FAD/FMN-containing dehydrogenase
VNDEMNQDLLSRPGSSAYRAATTPHNCTTAQKPAVVAHPHSAAEVAQAVRWAADRDLGVAVQASGHGAGAPIGANQVLIDTSALNDVSIDPAARIAHAGAGTTWSALNSTALAGTVTLMCVGDLQGWVSEDRNGVVQGPPLPGGDHQSLRVAVLPVLAELS